MILYIILLGAAVVLAAALWVISVLVRRIQNLEMDLESDGHVIVNYESMTADLWRRLASREEDLRSAHVTINMLLREEERIKKEMTQSLEMVLRGT